MKSDAKTVAAYLKSLPEDRRHALSLLREVILKNLPAGYEEGIQYGMIGYYVPHSIYPAGYHCDPKQPLPFASIASQKNHMALYMTCIYADTEQQEWFCKAWLASGNKLDMGKSCVRFKKIENVPLDVVGKAIKRVSVKQFIKFYEDMVPAAAKRAGKSTTAKVAKKKPAKKTVSRKSTKTRKAVAGKTAARKSSTKSTAGKKAARKKVATRKVARKKVTSKKTASRRMTGKKARK